MKRLGKVLILGALMACATGQSAEAKKHQPPPTTGIDGLLYAAATCDMPTVKSLIASGVDLSAKDATGFDVLSRASLDRDTKLWESWGLHKPRIKTAWKLTCPSAVAALTAAGADPWKARFYQSPRLNESQPESIALIRVEDNRETKGKSGNLMEEMTSAVESQLGGHAGASVFHLGYPVISLNETRQKLLAAGFSAEDSAAPDRAKACKALGVDGVFEASLEDYRSSSAAIVVASGFKIKMALSDCKSGEPLWRLDQDYTLSEGILVRAFGGGKIKQIIDGFTSGDPALGFPPYENGFK